MKVDTYEKKIANLSGGQKKRVGLAKVLISNPDFLILDEPTNHLDAESIDWLEQHLQQYTGTVICITHDRYFLDHVAGWILELDRGEGIPWKGNYSSWLDQKTKRMAQEEKQASKRRKTLERELEWINMAPKARQAKGKARLNSYEALLNEDQKEREAKLEIFIPNGPRLGNKVIEAQHVAKAFGDKLLFDDLNFMLPPNGIVGVIGPNGAGKSTLMNMLGCLDVPTSGEYWLHGQDVSALTDDELSDIRNREIGFIFQGFNLIPNLTAVENVELPLIYRGVSRSVRQELSREALKKVGLEHRMDHKPSEMSGGQQQRVAIARAIAQAPPVILADEPTGNLDSNSTKEIMDILKGLHNEGRTVILITHDNDIAAQAKRVIKIKDGKVESDSGQIVPVEELQTAGA